MNHRELVADTEKWLEQQPKKDAAFQLEFLEILMRLQTKNPTPEREAIIRDTVDMLKKSKIHDHSEKEMNLDEIII
jgi:hypothetical protein